MSTAPVLKPLVISELNPSLNPILVVDGAGLDKLAAFLKRTSVFGWDYESNVTPTFFDRRIRTLQIGDRNEQYIVDFLAFAETKENLIASQGYFGRVKLKFLQPIIDAVKWALCARSHLKIGHNLEFEYTVSKWCLGMRPWNFYDTQTVEKVIYNGLVDTFATGFWGLEDLFGRYTGFALSKDEQKNFDLETPLTPAQILYAALDIRALFSIKNGQHKKLTEGNLFDAVQIENDYIPANCDIQINGMLLDESAWRNLKDENVAELKQTIASLDELFVPLVGSKFKDVPDDSALPALEEAWRSLNNKSPEEEELSAQIKKLAGVKNKDARVALMAQRGELELARKARRNEASATFKAANKAVNDFRKESAKWEGEARINYGAPGQLYAALLKGPFGFTKDNLPGTKDAFLEKHAEKPVIKLIRRMRKLDKAIGTYGEQWLRLRTDPEEGYVDPNTLRLHAKVNANGTETGRASCSNPNLFNLPRDDRYRACFISRPGYKMITIDMSGQELRIMTEFSREPVWIEAFNKGWDVHSVCAEMLYMAEWKSATVTEEYEYYSEKEKEIVKIPKCYYYFGHPKKGDHVKCKCPKHEELRAVLKAINFGIAYGMTQFRLAAELEISVDDAEELLRKYKTRFPVLWAYLEGSGKKGLAALESRTASNRRRKFRKVEWDQAIASAKKKYTPKWNKEAAEKSKKLGIKVEPRTEPNHNEIMRQYKAIQSGIQREAMNTPVQGTGADQMKLALGCGFDENDKPYLWHELEPKYGALLENFVYDEIVFETPEGPGSQDIDPYHHGQNVWISPFYEGDPSQITEDNVQAAYDFADEALCRAGARYVKTIPVETEGHKSNRWMK